jgi:hypothetical protein
MRQKASNVMQCKQEAESEQASNDPEQLAEYVINLNRCETLL